MKSFIVILTLFIVVINKATAFNPLAIDGTCGSAGVCDQNLDCCEYETGKIQCCEHRQMCIQNVGCRCSDFDNCDPITASI